MQINILKCPDKKFRPYIRNAVSFYAEEIFSKKMLEQITIKIKFEDDLDVYGSAMIDEWDDNDKPSIFLLEIHSNISAADVLKTLAHEMVHIKQFFDGTLNESITKWKNKKINPNLNYYDSPWEIEAFGLEIALFSKFAIKEKLWDVFQGIQDPDAPVKKVPLGWK